jgi:tRNA dimethylallyltransferase
MAAKPGPLVVIVGETASGKSATAIELAQKIDGEIICADSRTIYKGMDIGTAKPSTVERELIPHHLLDLIEPDQKFSAAEFKRLANKTIDDIHARGKTPILVGGSGLYIDAIIFDYQFNPESAERNSQNPRHLKNTGTTIFHTLRPNTCIYGIKLDREVLKDRINKRVKNMLETGLLQEINKLSEQYGWDAPGLNAPAYKAFRPHLEGRISLDGAKALFAKYDLELAKRQRTWFKRNKRIQWLNDRSKIVDIATTKLNKSD